MSVGCLYPYITLCLMTCNVKGYNSPPVLYRCWTLLEGTRREALDAVLDVSDVVLMTQVGADCECCSKPCRAAFSARYI